MYDLCYGPFPHQILERRAGIQPANTGFRDEALIRDYIRLQEQEDKRMDQLNMWR
jgi:hypothetical protein